MEVFSRFCSSFLNRKIVALSIRKSEDLEQPFAEIIDPFGIQTFSWISDFRKLYTFSKEIDKLTFYDIPSGVVAVVRELKIEFTDLAFSSDYEIAAVVSVNKSNKEYIQLLSMSDFSQLATFEIKAKYSKSVLFTKNDNCILVCERHYNNGLYLYTLSGYLVAEYSLESSFSSVKSIDENFVVNDESGNLFIFDDVCLNILVSRNTQDMIESMVDVKGLQETKDEQINDIHKKKRSVLKRFCGRERIQGRRIKEE